MRVFSMRAERFAVICHHRDQRLIVKPMLLECIKQLAYARVRVCNLTVIGLGCVVLFIGRRRIVRVMRIIEMHPQEKWPARHLAEPAESMIHDVPSPPLDGFIAIHPMPPQMKSGVIHVKSAIEPGSRSVQWIEN